MLQMFYNTIKQRSVPYNQCENAVIKGVLGEFPTFSRIQYWINK